MALQFDTKHPFSLDFEFEIPVLYEGNLFTKLTEVVNPSMSYELLKNLVYSKFFNNVKLTGLFKEFKDYNLIPEKPFHPNEGEVITDVAFYFNSLEQVEPELENIYYCLEGNYKAILDEDYKQCKMKVPKMRFHKTKQEVKLFKKTGQFNFENDYFVKKTKDGSYYVSVCGNTVMFSSSRDNLTPEFLVINV